MNLALIIIIVIAIVLAIVGGWPGTSGGKPVDLVDLNILETLGSSKPRGTLLLIITMGNAGSALSACPRFSEDGFVCYEFRV